jgi:hypothetical protein
MSNSSEKLVKYTIKLICKSYELDYDEVKQLTKKVLKTAKKSDEQLLGMMEELLDLGNIGSEEELDEFDSEVLKVYCKIKDIDVSEVSEKKLRSVVWNTIQEEFELSESDSESEDSEDYESEQDEVVIPKATITEIINEVDEEEIPEPEPKKKHKKKV